MTRCPLRDELRRAANRRRFFEQRDAAGRKQARNWSRFPYDGLALATCADHRKWRAFWGRHDPACSPWSSGP